MGLEKRVLEFLYSQVSDNKIPQIRKGMVEDFTHFVQKELAALEVKVAASTMQQKRQQEQRQAEEKKGEGN